MWERFTRLFTRKPPFRPGPPARPRLVLTECCVAALSGCMEPEIEKGHEGVAYLFGQSDGTNTLAVAAIRPHARTAPGSFAVDSPAMARVVRTTVDCGLQLVGQVHTHPGRAYHSGGDEAGARIAYSGYVSIVLPDYGRRLPQLEGAAAYMFRAGAGFAALEQAQITSVPARMA